jgi:lipoprotein-anchoring transpeptidase ErfK/SrfK
MLRNALATACLSLALLTPAAGAATPERLPEGATIAGVAVGGLGPYGARVELRRQLEPKFEQPIEARVHGRRTLLATARLGQVVHYGEMVDAAYEQLSRGELVHVRLVRTIDGDTLTAAVSALARPFYRSPRNARARFGITHVARIAGRSGRSVDVGALRRDLLAELRTPKGARWVRGRLVTVKPAVRRADLRRIYPTYVSVSRRGRTVRLFKRLRLARRYTVAVGAAGYDTPAGMHRVLSKQVNPTWYVPNRPWAGSLAGQTIPPGDSRNPLKARFIALGGGVGFHGTADLASIGQAASHGCIRMRIPDVISLYNRVSVGTPVLIR